MEKRGNTKGLSTIIATLLIILLVLVAVGILWVVIKNVIQQGAEQISLGKFTLDLKIEKIQIINNNLNVTVKRNSGSGEFVGIIFVIDDGENSEAFTRTIYMNEFEKRTFSLIPEEVNISNIKTIGIAPIFGLESGKEIIGDVKDTWDFSTSPISQVTQCIPTCVGKQCGSDGCSGSCGTCTGGQVCNSIGQCVTTCTDTCLSLGYSCGTHTICGSSVNCGTCTLPQTCNSTGQCVTTCTDTCLSLGYSCGTHTICGSSVNCGTCTLPQTCNTTNQCSTSAQTWTWTNELITNGGFEDGDLTGWIEENGDYGQGFSVGNHMGNSQYVLPQSGSYQAWDDGASSDASGVDFYLYQDVNLGSYASYIDAGNAKMNASGWGATSEKTGGADTTRIQFIFLDISHNELETAINSGWIYWVNGTWWKRGVTNYNIPVNTRYIRVWASSYENCGGDYCDSGTWDSFSVKLGYFA